MNGRDRARTASTRSAGPAMYPPAVPNPFASVPMNTVNRSAMPSRAAMPAPCGPYMPTACTSSTNVAAWNSSARSANSASGATSPDIEYTDSSTISLGRSGSAAASSSRRWATSLWRKMRFSAPLCRSPSMIEAWFSASEKTSVPGARPASTVSAPSLAV